MRQRVAALSKGARRAPQEIRIDFAVLPDASCIFYIASPRNGRGCVLLNRQRADQRGFGITRRPRVLRLH